MAFRAPSQRAVTPQNRGRYPGFDVLEQADSWDDVTAGVVLARLAPTTDLSFFTLAEDAVARPLCDLLLAQDGEPRIPVVALIDARLAAAETDGWRYADMPPDPEAWRATLAALDDDAEHRYDRLFHECSSTERGALVQAVFTAGQHDERWHDWPAKHVWSLWTRYACAAFYSHPWSWNEIGFGGPAYPRGYKNVGVNSRERWEVRDDTGSDRRGDPIPFADRVEAARNDQRAVTGADSAPHGETRARQGGGGS